MKFVSILLYFLVQQTVGEPDLIKFFGASADSLKGSSTDPTNPFLPDQALTNGSRFWQSGSEIHENEVITFTAFFNDPMMIEGIQIGWLVSPDEIQVSTSMHEDGSGDSVVLGWQPSGTKETYTEEIKFKTPTECRSVNVRMKGKRKQEIAIEAFFGIGVPGAIGMIVSGVTVERVNDENCMYVESGILDEPNVPVVLGPCKNALAYGDNRELWIHTPLKTLRAAFSDPPVCLGAERMVSEEGHPENTKIVIETNYCDLLETSMNGRWEFTMNGQLKSMLSASAFGGQPEEGNGWCLSADGESSTPVDLVTKLKPIVTASSSHPEHPTINMHDGSLKSYWSTKATHDLKQRAEVQIDFADGHILSAVEIEWEFPPMAYNILGSNDQGLTWLPIIEPNFANSGHLTHDEIVFNSALAQGIKSVKIEMKSIHPELGFPEFERELNNRNYYYGIRALKLFDRPLNLTLHSCLEAANKKDARDKFFKIRTRMIDPRRVKEFFHMKNDMHSGMKSLASLLASFSEKLPSADKCKEEASKIFAEYRANKKGRMAKVLEAKEMFNKEQTSDAFTRIGDSSILPAESCEQIKSKYPDSPSGWYHVENPCSVRPLRGYCAMDNTVTPRTHAVDTRFVYPYLGRMPQPFGTDISNSVPNVDSVVLRCAESGLDVYALNSKADVDVMRRVMKDMKLDVTLGGSNVPVAYDWNCRTTQGCSGVPRSMLYERPLSSVLSSIDPSIMQSLGEKIYDTVYISEPSGSLKPSFWGEKIATFFCEGSNESEEFQSPYVVDLTCFDTAMANVILQQGTSPYYNLRCPARCDRVDSQRFGSVRVIGGPTLYDQSSSICRSAIHADVINAETGGQFYLSFENPPVKDGYISTTNNGITSDALELKHANAFAIRLTKNPILCPIQTFQLERDVPLLNNKKTTKKANAKALSFLGFRRGEDEDEDDSSPFLSDNVKDSSGSCESKEDPSLISVDSEVKELIEEMESKIDQIHAIDPKTVTQFEATVDEKLHMGYKALKPAGEMDSEISEAISRDNELIEPMMRLLTQKIEKETKLAEDARDTKEKIKQEIDTGISFTSRLRLLAPYSEEEKMSDNPLGVSRFTNILSSDPNHKGKWNWRIDQSDQIIEHGKGMGGEQTMSDDDDLVASSSKLIYEGDVRGDNTIGPRGDFLFIKDGSFYDFEFRATFEASVFFHSASVLGFMLRATDLANGIALELQRESSDFGKSKINLTASSVMDGKRTSTIAQKPVFELDGEQTSLLNESHFMVRVRATNDIFQVTTSICNSDNCDDYDDDADDNDEARLDGSSDDDDKGDRLSKHLVFQSNQYMRGKIGVFVLNRYGTEKFGFRQFSVNALPCQGTQTPTDALKYGALVSKQIPKSITDHNRHGVVPPTKTCSIYRYSDRDVRYETINMPVSCDKAHSNSDWVHLNYFDGRYKLMAFMYKCSHPMESISLIQENSARCIKGNFSTELYINHISLGGEGGLAVGCSTSSCLVATVNAHGIQLKKIFKKRHDIISKEAKVLASSSFGETVSEQIEKTNAVWGNLLIEMGAEDEESDKNNNTTTHNIKITFSVENLSHHAPTTLTYDYEIKNDSSDSRIGFYAKPAVGLSSLHHEPEIAFANTSTMPFMLG